MFQAKNLKKLADSYLDLITKWAAYPSEHTLKPIIENVLNGLKETQPEIFKGVKGISNLTVQNQLDYFAVSFVLDVDRAYVEANAEVRSQTLAQAVEKQSGYFGAATLKVRVGTFSE